MKILHKKINQHVSRYGKFYFSHILSLIFLLLLFNIKTYAQCPSGYELVGETEENYICIKVSRFTGNWKSSEKAQVKDALRAVKDESIRNWIMKNVELERTTINNEIPVSASAGRLKFKDSYFAKGVTDSARDNLLVFEAGKAFWHKMKDTPLPSGGTLTTWFGGFAGEHLSVIIDMRKAKYNNENLTRYFDSIDTDSSFGHVFRAMALELENPSEDKSQKKWDSAMNEFRSHIEPLLKMKP
jgi:hypothetical protein